MQNSQKNLTLFSFGRNLKKVIYTEKDNCARFVSHPRLGVCSCVFERKLYNEVYILTGTLLPEANGGAVG